METIHLACGVETDTVKLDIKNNYIWYTYSVEHMGMHCMA